MRNARILFDDTGAEKAGQTPLRAPKARDRGGMTRALRAHVHFSP